MMRFSLCLLVLGFLVMSQPAQGQTSRPVGKYNLEGSAPYLVAHYVMWFKTPWSVSDQAGNKHEQESWKHWEWNGKGQKHDPGQKIPEGKRDIASIMYPAIGAYDSGSRAVIRYHLALMKASGISAVSALWYGPDSDTDRNMPMLLDEAQKIQLRVFICYEEKLNFPGYRHPKDRNEIVKSAFDDLNYLYRTYSVHPAYLKRGGIPIVQQFNAFGKDPVLGDHSLTPEEWKEVFSNLPGKIEYIRQNLSAKYHPVIPAAYVWWDQGDWPRQFADQAGALCEQSNMDFFMSMVCPGFNDTGVWGWGEGPRVSKGYGADVLSSTMHQALRGNPELVQLVTWNDFNEGTCFEPTVQNGTHFLEQLGNWWHETTQKQVHLDDLSSAIARYKTECSDVERAEIP